MGKFLYRNASFKQAKDGFTRLLQGRPAEGGSGSEKIQQRRP
jgi:hypothetical protein